MIEALGNLRGYANICDYRRIPNKPGVYILVYIEDGKTKAFTRLNGIDYEGILAIGKSVRLGNRIREFYKDILSEGLKEKYHSEGWNFRAYFRDNPKSNAVRLKPENVWAYWTLRESEKKANEFETQLIQHYVMNFQDKPPLNISIKRQL